MGAELPGAFVRSIGIMGAGSFGKFVKTVVERFLPEVRITMYDPAINQFQGNFNDTARCDIIFLAVPISQFEATLKAIVPKMDPASLLVDVCTVKAYTVGLLHKHAGHLRWIATHPMFGPESYGKRGGNMQGFRIVVADSTLPDPVEEMVRGFLKKLGLCIVDVSADEHDYHLARTLFLTHFVGQAVSKCDFDRTEIDTVSFGFLMDAVESVKHDKALFLDVFRYNKHCLEMMRQFVHAQVDLMVELAGMQHENG